MLQSLHEEHGVTFHLECSVESIDHDSVKLSDGSTLPADIVIIGAGVRPETALAEEAGLEVDNGVVVDKYLETSKKGIFAAGDTSRWPNPFSDESIRVEHWVVAQRLGQVAAHNMLGVKQPFDSAPFFWTQHYEIPVAYVGHGAGWDQIDVAGSIADHDCLVAFRKNGKTLAVAGIYRDEEMLKAEAAMERGDEAALQQLIPSGG
jgi:NADPH-dependent 2,4-dienoyl-CoA reductase/sulfur reductase-like enzyme